MKKAGSLLLIAVTILFVGFVMGLFIGRNSAPDPLPRTSQLVSSEEDSPCVSESHREETVPNTMHQWRININEASLEELDLLPGIGPSLAQRILDFRSEHGPFTSLHQLTEVSGIGEATFEELKDYVILEDTP